MVAFGQMMNKLAPSILAADFSILGEQIKKVESAGAEYLHIDVMDGSFVPSISFGLPLISSIRKSTGLTFDVHLMVTEPERFVDQFADAGANILTVHQEACTHLNRTLKHIKERGVKTGVALNPATDISTLKYVLNYVDMILVMSVNPGNAGQMYLPYVSKKYDKLLPLQKEMGFDTYWDGACSADKIKEFAPKGVKGFVLGTTLLFGKKKSYKEAIEEIRNLA